MLKELVEVFKFSRGADADGNRFALLDDLRQCAMVIAPDGILMHVNDSGLHMLEADNWSQIDRAAAPAFVAQNYREEWSLIHSRVCGGDKVAWEFEILGLRGRRSLVESYGVPVELEGGRKGHLALMRDITDRRLAEAAMQNVQGHLGDLVEQRTRELKETSDRLGESQQDFELLVNSVTDYAIYRLDLEGNVASWNVGAQRIKGYCADEIIGRNFSQFYTAEDRIAGLPKRGLGIAAQEGRFGSEGWRVRKDGSRFWASVVIDAIRSQGRLVGFAKVTRDVTDRKIAEEKLRQAEKLQAIGQMTGGAAHDFNNLLMAIHGSLELLRKRLVLDPKDLSLLDNALHGAKRGAALTQRMLAFARRQDLKAESVDLAGLTRGIWELIQQSVTPQITVEARFPPNLPRVSTDQGQLENALINLIVNARDAMPAGGAILISGDAAELSAGNEAELPPGRYVRLAVIDEGEGMDAETLSHVTEPFYTTKGVGKGTGLGLSMVDGVAAQSGGRLVIHSEKGKGTNVEIWLPVDEDASDITDTEESPPSNVTQARKLRVLAVDDDALVLLNTVAMLEELGHHPFQATSGKHALAFLETGQPVDLLMTDQAMPGMTGTQLIEAMKARWPRIPAILATGYAELPSPSQTPLLRLSKPFDLDHLSHAIDEAMAG